MMALNMSFMLSVANKPSMLKVVMLSVVMLSVLMLSVLMLSVLKLSVLMLSVVGPVEQCQNTQLIILR
jgi:hypothetical protein